MIDAFSYYRGGCSELGGGLRTGGAGANVFDVGVWGGNAGRGTRVKKYHDPPLYFFTFLERGATFLNNFVWWGGHLFLIILGINLILLVRQSFFLCRGRIIHFTLWILCFHFWKFYFYNIPFLLTHSWATVEICIKTFK